MTRADTLRNALAEARNAARAARRTLRTAEWGYQTARTAEADAQGELLSHLHLTRKGPETMTPRITQAHANELTREEESLQIERWDDRDSGDEDSAVILSGNAILRATGHASSFAVRVRDCHEDWRALQGAVPGECLTDALYARMCAEVGLDPTTPEGA